MRNVLRVIAFDILAPLAIIVGLDYIGFVLDWPLWWAAVGAVLGLLVVLAALHGVPCAL